MSAFVRVHPRPVPPNLNSYYQAKSGALYDQIQAEFEKQAADFKAKKS